MCPNDANLLVAGGYNNIKIFDRRTPSTVKIIQTETGGS